MSKKFKNFKRKELSQNHIFLLSSVWLLQFPKELMAKSETSFDFNSLESRKVVTESITNHYHKFFFKKLELPERKKSCLSFSIQGLF